MRRIYIVLVALTAGAACGSSPSSPGDVEGTITIGATGIAPKEVRINAWGTVRFVNADTRPHTIVSDPVDLHTQCPPLNRVGLLQPGESRETGTLNLPGACGFQDHEDQVDAFRGGSWFGSG